MGTFLENPIFDLSKSKYPETNNIPLMSSPGPVAMILATYLLFVLKIGPAFMKKREAFKLTEVLIVYNAVQVAISVHLVQLFFRGMLFSGLFPKVCYIESPDYRERILWGIWTYHVAKITELLDTVFFVLRKKDNQVTFLHVYHHSIMMIGTWAFMKYWPSHTVIYIGFINSLVHVFMYTYYGLAAFGPKMNKYLTWKKYMTTFQLIQFVSIIIQYVIAVNISECKHDEGMITFIFANTVFFFLLFANFYRQSYVKKKKEKNAVLDVVKNGKPADNPVVEDKEDSKTSNNK